MARKQEAAKWCIAAGAIALALWLGSRSALVQEALIAYLPDFGGMATTYARRSFNDDNLRRVAHERIVSLGPRAVGPLLRTVEDRDPLVRQHSVEALGLLGPLAQKAIPRLLPLTDADDPALRAAAVGTLTMIGASKAQLVPILLKLANDKDSHVRESVVAALTTLSVQNEEDAQAILHLLSSKYGDVRMAACEKSHDLSNHANALLPRLREMMAKDPDPNVRHEAEEAWEMLAARAREPNNSEN